MTYLMGIDLGTSSVKALITDEHGRTYGFGQIGYEVLTPRTGWAEQDPEIWWRCTGEAVRQAVLRSGISVSEITGIGLSGQMHGIVALDKAGEPIANSMIHLDQRSFREKEEIWEIADDLLEHVLRNRPATGMLICSLLWMKRNRPEEYERIQVVLSPKDYIRFRLSGEFATDYCDASAALALDLNEKKWCRELIRRLGLKEDIWVNILEASEIGGTVSPAGAEATGLTEGTKIAVGTGDCAAQLIGNGVTEEGTVACNIGTASQIAAVTGSIVTDENMCCQLWCHGVPNTWIFQGGAMNGGNTLSWLRNKILQTDVSYAVLDEAAGRSVPGCDGLLFLPYLAGERTPWNDPLARGVFFGLGLAHDQAALVRAVMEGVVYNLRLCKDIFDRKGIEQKRLVSSGGGAKGKTWKQIQADMMEMPVYTTEVDEEACLGAAILAAVGIGHYASVPEACREMVRIRPDVTEPIAANTALYKERREIFCELYQKVKGLYSKL